MDERIRCVASFSIRAGELRLVDDFCEAHDVSRSQVVRQGLRLALAEHPKAPVPPIPNRKESP